MRIILSIILIALTVNASFGQTESEFEINEVFVKWYAAKKKKRDFVRQTKYFFEDEHYVVDKTCKGEWGGAVIFTNKETGHKYTLHSTCPVVINKINGKYFITNTLAHLTGSTDIIEVEGPDVIPKIYLPVSPSVEMNEAHVGFNVLLDSRGILTLMSFPYQGQLYHVVADYEKTYLAKIINNRYDYIAVISNQSLRTYEPEVIKTKDNKFILFFKNSQAKGYINVHENKISVVRHK